MATEQPGEPTAPALTPQLQQDDKRIKINRLRTENDRLLRELERVTQIRDRQAIELGHRRSIIEHWQSQAHNLQVRLNETLNINEQRAALLRDARAVIVDLGGADGKMAERIDRELLAS